MSWLSWLSGVKGKSGRKASPRSTIPSLEYLEDRLAPIVGAYGLPGAIAPLAPMQPASQYDGVVNIDPGPGGFTGSLIRTGTGWGFGHQILTAAHVIGPNGPGALNVRFHLQRDGAPVPININVPANVAGGAQYQVLHSGFVFGVNTNGTQNDIGLLRLVDQVTPAPDRLLVAPFTAQQYSLYNGNPTEVGQQFTMVGYGLTGTGMNGNNQAAGVKRAGQNRFDSNGVPFNAAWMNYLLYDFDRLNDPGGQPNLDPMNVAFGIANPGLGAPEALQTNGDSGGPAFVGNNVIAGVFSQFRRTGMPPDIDGALNSSFGEFGLVTNVSRTIGDANLQGVLNPGGGAKYHLVLDMEQQVLGQDGIVENVGITVQRNVFDNNLLDLIITGTAANSLMGTYYSAPAANILSLTIRGSDDHETISIQTALGVGPITIMGRGGNDYIKVGSFTTGNLADLGGTVTVDGGTGDDWLDVYDCATAGTRTVTATSVQR